MRRFLLAASFVIAAPAPAFCAGMSIAMDEVRTITFAGPVSTVYVGNPAIADINMIDSRHAFVIGKGMGATNLIALNSDGKQIADTHIAVLAGTSASTLILNRGAQRVTYNCTSSHCEAVAEPGDSKDVFDTINSQLSAHSDTAHKAAAGQ